MGLLTSHAILATASIGILVNLTAIAVIIRRKRPSSPFHSLLVMLMAYDTLVVVCSALIFSLRHFWEEFDRDVFPVAVPWLMPIMHVAVMSSVYCTILIR